MWYKYFSKQSWNLRVWRKQNLKYNQDDIGMFQPKWIGRKTDLLFRATRAEGSLRGSFFFILFGAASVGSYIFSTYVTPRFEADRLAAIEDMNKNDAEAAKVLFYNRFGAPSRPMRSLEDLITFLSGSATYDQLADFASYNHAMDVNQDQQAGLDSWMTDQDKNMLKYYQKSIGKKVEGI